MLKIPVTPPIESVDALIAAWLKKNGGGGAQKVGTTCGDDDSSSGSSGEEDEWLRDDPYEVRDEAYRAVSNEEYTHALVEPFDRDTVKVGVDEFVRVTRRLHEKPPTNVPPHEYHQIDPGLLVRSVAIGCNIERMARLTASVVPYGELQMLENYDTTKVLHYVRENPKARQKVFDATSELLFSLMIVDEATRTPLQPPAITKKLAPPVDKKTAK
jgi:hypothetical protein